MKRFLLLSIFSFSLLSCAFDHAKTQGTEKSSSALINRPIPYAGVFQAVISPRCVSCHSAGGGNQGSINLETYESTFPLVARIEKAALREKTMPKDQALSDSEAQLLGTWIAQGATRNGAMQGSSKLREEVTWSVIKGEILEKKCLDCHSAVNAPGNPPPNPDHPPERFLDLSSIEQVRANISKIFDRAVVTQDMPLPPYERLTLEERQALAQWVALGMPE